MSINVLLTLVEQYKEAAQLIEAAQEQLKIQIREALAERSTNYLEVGCHKVRLSDFSSTRLDSKAIKTVSDAPFGRLQVQQKQDTLQNIRRIIS